MTYYIINAIEFITNELIKTNYNISINAHNNLCKIQRDNVCYSLYGIC